MDGQIDIAFYEQVVSKKRNGKLPQVSFPNYLRYLLGREYVLICNVRGSNREHVCAGKILAAEANEFGCETLILSHNPQCKDYYIHHCRLRTAKYWSSQPRALWDGAQIQEFIVQEPKRYIRARPL